MILGAWLTSLLCLLLPPFSVAAVFMLPLFLCPLAGSKKEAWAYPVGLAAILLGASLWTRQVFFPVWLLLAIAPPLVLAYRFPHMKLEFRQFLFWFVGAYALSADYGAGVAGDGRPGLPGGMDQPSGLVEAAPTIQQSATRCCTG